MQINLSYHHYCLSIASMPCVDCFPFISGVWFFPVEYDIEVEITYQGQHRPRSKIEEQYLINCNQVKYKISEDLLIGYQLAKASIAHHDTILCLRKYFNSCHDAYVSTVVLY